MTHEQNGTSSDLIVLGWDQEGKTLAARFPANQATLVAKAANALNLTVCKAEGAVLAELAKKLPSGRLYATGRGFVPAVGRKLFDKLVEQLKLAGQPAPELSDDQSGLEQPTGWPATWDDIAVGHMVIAQDTEYYGWWEAIVLNRDGDMLTLKWRDWPDYPNVVQHAGSVALLKPNSVNT